MNGAADLDAARAAVAATGRRMHADGLVTGTAGNVSVRVGGLIAVSPSGREYAATGPGDVSVVDLDGRVVDGPHTPSSETPLHLALYTGAEGDRIGAVVHHHGLHSTAVSLVHERLPPVHYYVVRLGGPPRVAPYATYGTEQLAAAVRTAVAGRSAALLQNHGAVAHGATAEEAYERSHLVEWLCQLYTTAAPLGTPRLLDEAELAAVAERRTAQ